MTKSLKKNYIYNTISQLVSILAPFITTPYISRVLEPAGNGRYSFTSSIVYYFTLAASMGTATYGQREISYCQDNLKERSKVFWEIELLSCFSVLLSLIAYVIFLAIDGFDSIYVIQVFSIIAVAADVSWLFTGMEQFETTVKRNVIFKLLNVAFIFLAVRSRNDLLIYAGGLSILTLIGNIIIWPAARGLISTVDIRELSPFRHLKGDLSLFIPTVAITVYTVLDKTMIGLITGSNAENGYYSQAQNISKAGLVLVTALTSVMASRIGVYYSKNDTTQIRDKMYKSYNFAWIMSLPICFGLVGISSNVVPWFLGSGYFKSIAILEVTAFLVPAISLSNITGMSYLVPTKRQRYLTISVSAGAVINVIFNSFLIMRFQAAGAAIASVIAETSITAIQLFVVRHELSLKLIFKSAVKPLISALVMFAVIMYESTWLSPSILHTVIMILSGIVVYAVMLFILRDNFFLDTIKRK